MRILDCGGSVINFRFKTGSREGSTGKHYEAKVNYGATAFEESHQVRHRGGGGSRPPKGSKKESQETLLTTLSCPFNFEERCLPEQTACWHTTDDPIMKRMLITEPPQSRILIKSFMCTNRPLPDCVAAGKRLRRGREAAAAAKRSRSGREAAAKRPRSGRDAVAKRP